MDSTLSQDFKLNHVRIALTCLYQLNRSKEKNKRNKKKSG